MKQLYTKTVLQTRHSVRAYKTDKIGEDIREKLDVIVKDINNERSRSWLLRIRRKDIRGGLCQGFSNSAIGSHLTVFQFCPGEIMGIFDFMLNENSLDL